MVITLGNLIFNTSHNGNTPINFTGKKVLDEVRGYLIFVNQHWVFVGPSQINAYGKKAIKKLSLVLESPHKNEFDQYNNPLRPANGKTGNAINSKLSNRPWVNKNLNSNYYYEIYIMNPVQYQASCYCVLGNNCSRNNTNQVFRKLFSKLFFNLRNDFINRINTYMPDMIINCCSSCGSLKKTVEVAIKESSFYSNNHYVIDYHPSKW